MLNSVPKHPSDMKLGFNVLLYAYHDLVYKLLKCHAHNTLK